MGIFSTRAAELATLLSTTFLEVDPAPRKELVPTGLGKKPKAIGYLTPQRLGPSTAGGSRDFEIELTAFIATRVISEVPALMAIVDDVLEHIVGTLAGGGRFVLESGPDFTLNNDPASNDFTATITARITTHGKVQKR